MLDADENATTMVEKMADAREELGTGHRGHASTWELQADVALLPSLA